MRRILGFLKTYLVVSLIFGMVDLADNILTFLKFNDSWYAVAISIFFFLFFFFNILSLIIFRYHRVPRIAYVLPFYYLVSYVLFILIALSLTLLTVLPPWLVPATVVLGVITSLFEMGFSIYLLQKIDFAPAL